MFEEEETPAWSPGPTFARLWPLEETSKRDGFWSWFVGPGFLGGTIAALLAAGWILIFVDDFVTAIGFRLLEMPALLICAWFCGTIAGMTARDEFLREDWAHRRVLVGFGAGCILGIAGGVVIALGFSDWWAWIPAIVASALGGLFDALIYRNVLEEGI